MVDKITGGSIIRIMNSAISHDATVTNIYILNPLYNSYLLIYFVIIIKFLEKLIFYILF